jgi:hypothetical protein
MPVRKGTPAYDRKLAAQRLKYHEEKIREQATEKIAAIDTAKTLARLDPARWRKDPVGWAEARLGVDPRTLRWSLYGGAYDTHPWDGDRDPLATALEALAAGKWVGLESGKGTGKTFGLAAIASLWFLENFLPDPTVVSLAPKEKQLELHMWKQIGRFMARFRASHPVAELKRLHLQMRSDEDPEKASWNAWGYAAGSGQGELSAARAQGFHDENQLFILEEGPGIKSAIVTAVEETNTRPGTNLILMIGNPEHQLDSLHRYCTSPGVVHIRASALDHPNVVLDNPDLMKGAVTRGSVERLRKKHGEDSPRFKAAVRGLSPAEAEDALIKLSWLQAAAERVVPDGADALGVDVSNSVNGDPAAIAYGSGARLNRVESFQCPDANKMAREKVAPLILGDGFMPGIAAGAVGVDGIGVGAGAVNELLRLGLRIVNIQSSSDPVVRKVLRPDGVQIDDVEVYGNLRAQMYDTLADDLQYGRVGGPGFADPELQRELTAVKAGPRNGKTYIQEKDKVRFLIGRSPNKADAVVYWNWVRQAGGRRSISGLGAMVDW